MAESSCNTAPAPEVALAAADTAVAGKGHARVSKKRWAEITDLLRSQYGSDSVMDETIRKIEEILQFDPTQRTYTVEETKRMTEWRRKKAEKSGQSLYVMTGAKRSYERKKASVRLLNGDAQPEPPTIF